jgi:hypothetical protein
MRAYLDHAAELTALERSGDPQERFPERSLVELHDEPNSGRVRDWDAAHDFDVNIRRLHNCPPGLEHVRCLDDYEQRQPSVPGIVPPPGAAGLCEDPLATPFHCLGGDHDAARDCKASACRQGIPIGFDAQREFSAAARMARTMLCSGSPPKLVRVLTLPVTTVAITAANMALLIRSFMARSPFTL